MKPRPAEHFLPVMLHESRRYLLRDSSLHQQVLNDCRVALHAVTQAVEGSHILVRRLHQIAQAGNHVFCPLLSVTGQQHGEKLGAGEQFGTVTRCLGATFRGGGMLRSILAMSFSASPAVLLSSLAALLNLPAPFSSPLTLAEA